MWNSQPKIIDDLLLVLIYYFLKSSLFHQVICSLIFPYGIWLNCSILGFVVSVFVLMRSNTNFVVMVFNSHFVLDSKRNIRISPQQTFLIVPLIAFNNFSYQNAIPMKQMIWEMAIESQDNKLLVPGQLQFERVFWQQFHNRAT